MDLRDRLLGWLGEERPSALARLFAAADQARRASVGEAVHLRGLVEISNACGRSCHYCGLRAARPIPRYRLSHGQILDAGRLARDLGYGTVVLQSGQDPELSVDGLARTVRSLRDLGLAVTLSLGERTPEELAHLKDAGADRYLLKLETTDQALYAALHGPREHSRRPSLLLDLARLGYAVGSGNLVGLPGQSLASLADDLLAFQRLDLDMISTSPFLPHPQTPLGGTPGEPARKVRLTRTVLALARLLNPRAAMPATTALSSADPEEGLLAGLRGGANVVMPDLTPPPYRGWYDIYPGKPAGLSLPGALAGDLTPHERHHRLLALLESLGRTPGTGRGDPRPGPVASLPVPVPGVDP